MDNPSFATRWNLDQIDSNYSKWLADRSSVDSNWQLFFEGFHLASNRNGSEKSIPSQKPVSVQASEDDSVEKQMHACTEQIYAFRDIGHTQGTFDPLRGEN